LKGYELPFCENLGRENTSNYPGELKLDPRSWMDRLRHDTKQRYWSRVHGVEVNIVDIGGELGQIRTEVKIVCPMSHNTLTIVEEYVQ
jgi:hypothetical protein